MPTLEETSFNKQFSKEHPFIALLIAIGGVATILFTYTSTGNTQSVFLFAVSTVLIVLAFATPPILFFRSRKENRSVVALLVALSTLVYFLYSQYDQLLKIMDLPTVVQTIF